MDIEPLNKYDAYVKKQGRLGNVRTLRRIRIFAFFAPEALQLSCIIKEHERDGSPNRQPRLHMIHFFMLCWFFVVVAQLRLFMSCAEMAALSSKWVLHWSIYWDPKNANKWVKTAPKSNKQYTSRNLTKRDATKKDAMKKVATKKDATKKDAMKKMQCRDDARHRSAKRTFRSKPSSKERYFSF